MFRLCFLTLIIVSNSCVQREKSTSIESARKPISDTTIKEYKLSARFNSFDTVVEVLFTNTKDSPNSIQMTNYKGFISKQDMITPEILNKIFEFYKDAYEHYKEGWMLPGKISEEELEKYLPTPTTAENLKPYITPLLVFIQNKQNCEEGTIGIEFDCTWDLKSGLGVLIKNWNVKLVSIAQIAYFY